MQRAVETVGENLHPQVEIAREGGGLVRVDEAMAPLLEALWEYGFETAASCVSFPSFDGYAYVGFTNDDDKQRFLAAVQSVTAEGLVLFEPDETVSSEQAALQGAWAVSFPSEALRDVTAVVQLGGWPKVGRNEPCPSESGEKFKN